MERRPGLPARLPRAPVAIGRPFIANPDPVERIRLGAPLAEANQARFYGGDAAGYTDYPTLGQSATA